MFSKEGAATHEAMGVSDHGARPWSIPRQTLIENFNAGLSVLDDLLKKDSLTDFQEKLIEALLIYSKAALSKDLSDRLLYTTVALETLFLRDNNEIIQDNLSLRMALMSPVSVGERRKIVQNVKTVYGLRSKLVHHGENIRLDDMAHLKTFCLNAWYGVFPLIALAATPITRNQFFEDLENRKVSG